MQFGVTPQVLTKALQWLEMQAPWILQLGLYKRMRFRHSERWPVSVIVGTSGKATPSKSHSKGEGKGGGGGLMWKRARHGT